MKGTVRNIQHREVELLVGEAVTLEFKGDEWSKGSKIDGVISNGACIKFDNGGCIRWNSGERVKFADGKQIRKIIFHDIESVLEKLKFIKSIHWTKPKTRTYYKENRNMECRWISSIHGIRTGKVIAKGKNIYLKESNGYSTCLYGKDIYGKDDGKPSCSIISVELIKSNENLTEETNLFLLK